MVCEFGGFPELQVVEDLNPCLWEASESLREVCRGTVVQSCEAIVRRVVKIRESIYTEL